jgi:sensor histidine kinase YesM
MPDTLPFMLLFYRYTYIAETIVLAEKDTSIVTHNYYFTAESKQKRKTVISPTAPGGHVTFLVRVYNPYANVFHMGFRAEFLATTYKIYAAARGRSYHEAFSDYIFNIMFLAVVVFITLHTMVQYFIRRRKEFLFYAFYSTTVFLYFLYRLEFSTYYDVLFSYFPYVYKYCNNPLIILIYFAYFKFARQFVDFKSLWPWFNRTIIWGERLVIVAIVVDIICNVLNNYEIRNEIFAVVRILILIISCIGIYLLLRSNKKVLYFFGIGSLILLIGAWASLIFTYFPQWEFLGLDTMKYTQYSVVLELLCFTSGLSYKSYLIEIEKRQTQLQLIMQLEENRLLQEELNNRLESRVKEQTNQIIVQQQQLEKEREQQLTLEFTKKITEMELQLLKSQLNPHFYFNTLNNLYGLAMIAPKKAPDAILKLSDIMEYVIYDCRHDKVPLGKELKFLQSYIELERLRYEDNARISLTIDGKTNGQSISPMLLIQFVENGFKHGMELQKGNSYLRIHIAQDNGRLKYESINSINGQSFKEGGVGLTNLRKRLEILYPGKHSLEVFSNEQVFRVVLEVEL